MGEIFKFERPPEVLPFTGERLTTAVRGQIEVEHLHRYMFARELCRGKDVLDVASGEGYGSALLAQVAARVIGVEIDTGAAGHAARAYRKDNLSYIAGDARRLPLADDSADVIVSFETIEHFFDHDGFLCEVRRVLRPGGVLVISTPDQDVYSPAGEPANRFHVRELSKQEFHHALGRHFPHVRILGQRIAHGSVLVCDDPVDPGLKGGFITYERRDDLHFERSSGLPRSKYLVACASDAPPGRDLAASSIYVDMTSVATQAEHAAAERALEESARVIAGFRSDEDRWRGDITSIAAELAGAKRECLEREAAVAETEAALRQCRVEAAAELAAVGHALASREHEVTRLAADKARQQEENVALAETARILTDERERQEVAIAELSAACRKRQEESGEFARALAGSRQGLEQQAGVIAELVQAEARSRETSGRLAEELELARQRGDEQSRALAEIQELYRAARAEAAVLTQALTEAREHEDRAVQAVSLHVAARQAAETVMSTLLARSTTDRRETVALVSKLQDLEGALSAARDGLIQLRDDRAAASEALAVAAVAPPEPERTPSPARLFDPIPGTEAMPPDQAALLRRFLGWRTAYPVEMTTTLNRLVAKARRFARRNDWAGAERWYRQTLQYSPRLATAWVQYGHVIKAQGDLWAACGAYARAIELDPMDANTLVDLGHAQKNLGLAPEAVASLRRALRLRPSRQDIWEDLGRLGQDPVALAAELLDSDVPAVGAQGSGRGLRFRLARRRARAASRARDWSLAARRYRRVLALAPQDARSWLMLGHALKEAGDPSGAGGAYLQALALDPANQEPRRHFDALPHAARPLQAGALPGFQHDLQSVTALQAEPPTAPRAGVFALTAGQDLSQVEDGVFLTTGFDPQFALSSAAGPLPTGWTTLTIEASRVDPVLRPVLYVWDGDAVQSLELPIIADTQPVEAAVHLPDQVTALRFDPTNEPGVRFGIRSITFTERAGPPEALRRDASKTEYDVWVRLYDTLGPDDAASIRRLAAALPWRPLLSIVMPVYDPDPAYLRRALDTVMAQLYEDWELCIADDASTKPEIRRILRDYASRDARIKTVFRAENGHICAASNSALDLARGAFVVLMDHDDELPAHALYMVATELNRFPDADVIYTDEDKIDASGKRHDPHFKTDWNQDLFYSQNMLAHLGVFRTALVRDVGSFRVGFEGSQDYDLALRVLAATTRDRIRHVPFILYHWRIFSGVESFSTNHPRRSVDTAHRALSDYFEHIGQPVEVLPNKAFPGWWRIRRPTPEPLPSVTLIVPTRDRVNLLRNCVDGLLYGTDYADVEVIVVDNGSEEPGTKAYFRELGLDRRVRVLRVDGPFNYSALNNRAVDAARGEYIGFVNNDIEVADPGWLREAVSQVVRPGVGAVGVKLLYANGAIQHAGVTLGVYGVAAHAHRNFPADAIGYFGRPQLQQELSAVTAAMLVMPRRVFHEVGGFDEVNLTVGYNDVDLCLRIRAAGYQIVYTPFAELLHLESASRGANATPEQQERDRRERAFMTDRWGDLLTSDPCYSPNLSLADETFRLSFPPRVVKPWLQPFGGLDFATREQRRFDAVHEIDASALRDIAARTAVMVAGHPDDRVFTHLVEGLSPGGPLPARIVVVDASASGDDRAWRHGSERLAKRSPAVGFDAVRDDGQDFSPARAANIGMRATAGAEYVLVVTRGEAFAPCWFEYLLRALLASGRDTIVASRMCLPDAKIEVATALRVPGALDAEPVPAGYEDLPSPRVASHEEIAAGDVLRSESMILGGAFLGRRALLCDLDEGAMFDERLLGGGWEEDLSLRLQARGASFASTSASLVTLGPDLRRAPGRLWEHVHDYLWLNRKWSDVADAGVIEFICPFHRGDVLVGLQVAAHARRSGLNIRMHVAEPLLDWVRDFDPGFPVMSIPVAVPSAELTAPTLAQACLSVVQRPDASPRIALSHPRRGLDSTDRNLVEAMLESVGLRRDAKLVAARPKILPRHARRAADLLAPFGNEVVLLHRSGGWELKTLPDPLACELAGLLRQRDFDVVQIGGPDDARAEYCDGWITANLTPSTWAAIFHRARALVGVDSWSAHFAAILDVPQITFYGSTQPRHVNSKAHFAAQAAPSLVSGPVVECSPCNSLVCLRAPSPFCLGYALDKVAIGNFLAGLGTRAEHVLDGVAGA